MSKYNEPNFQLIIESSPTALIFVNSFGTITYLNSAAETLFLYNKSELIKRLDIDAHIEVAVNGKLGLDYLTCSGKYVNHKHFPQPGLIFLDINMPLMNGWEFLEEYKKLDKNQKAKHVVAMLSSSVNPDDLKKARSNNELVDYINKPLTFEKLKDIIYNFFPEE